MLEKKWRGRGVKRGGGRERERDKKEKKGRKDKTVGTPLTHHVSNLLLTKGQDTSSATR